MKDNRVLTGNLISRARELPVNVETPQLDDIEDLQIFLSRHEDPEPFFTITEKDIVISQLSGAGVLHFQLSNVRYHHLEAGDLVYVPAGTPHRYVPAGESILLTYKAARPGAEAVAWYCDRCGTEIFRQTYDLAEITSQDGRAAARARFGDNAEPTPCPECGHRPT